MEAPLSLCTLCEGIVFDDITGDAAANADERATQWCIPDSAPGLPALHASASTCSFCAYILFVIEEKIPNVRATLSKANPGTPVRITLPKPAYVLRSTLIELLPGWEHSSRHEEPEGLCLLSFKIECDEPRLSRRAAGWVYAGTKSVTEHLGIANRFPAARVLDAQCLDFITQCLKDCRDNHPECRVTTDGTMPTRLIDIGHGDADTPRLIESSLIRPSSYFALSYCWGPPSQTKPQLTTTNGTLASRRAGIPLSEMPGAIRDFVILSRRLGVRYVWIDALCIIQDDGDDWAREASLMFSVYRNADLTIVAAAGESCHSGFIDRQAKGQYAVIPFHSRKSPEISGSYILHSLQERRSWDADNPGHMHGTSWATRAWTFQEDILSTRVAYFNADTSFFRCQRVRRAENNVMTHKPLVRWHQTLAPPSSRAQTEDEKEKWRSDLYERWTQLLFEYSQRKLTKAEDKFPALSGLAQSFAQALDDEYVAGLWRGDLLNGLMWYIASDYNDPGVWRAPSWSWAALDGFVGASAHMRPSIPRARVEHVHIKHKGKDTKGMLTEAWMVIRGPLRPVSLRPAANRPSMTTAYADIFDRHSDTVLAFGTADHISPSGLTMYGTRKEADTEQFETMANVWALLLCFIPSFDFGEDEVTIVQSKPIYPSGILVTPTGEDDGVSGVPVYRRVGWFTTDEKNDLQLWEKSDETTIKLV